MLKDVITNRALAGPTAPGVESEDASSMGAEWRAAEAMDSSPPIPTPETVIEEMDGGMDVDRRSHGETDLPVGNPAHQRFGRHGEGEDADDSPQTRIWSAGKPSWARRNHSP